MGRCPLRICDKDAPIADARPLGDSPGPFTLGELPPPQLPRRLLPPLLLPASRQALISPQATAAVMTTAMHHHAAWPHKA